MKPFAEKYPERLSEIGIAEQNIAGLQQDLPIPEKSLS